MRTRHLAVIASCMLVAGLTAPASTAAAPHERVTARSWTPLSTSASPNFATAAVARTADGLQHVVWIVEDGAGANYEHTTIDASGRQGPVTRVLPAGWAQLGTPVDLGVNPDGGLRVAFRGSQDGNTANFFSYKGVYSAVSGDGGATWTVPREVLAPSVGDGGVTLAYTPDGRTITGFGDTGGFHWNVGSVPEAAVPTATVQEFTDQDAVGATLLRSGSVVWVVYQSIRGDGVFARQVWPSLGAPLRAPGSRTSVGAVAAAVDRPGVGPVVAYTAQSNVVLWDVGANRIHRVPGMKGPNNVSLATLDDGHLWIGAQGPIGYEPRASRVSERGWTVDREPARLPLLDVTFALTISSSAVLRAEILLTSNNYGDPPRINARSVAAQMVLRATPRRWRAGGAQVVAFRVTDVDGGVARATVRAAGHRCTTNRSGRCTIRITAARPGRITAKATRRGYDGAQVKLTVRR